MTRYVWGSRGVLLGVSPLSTVLCGVSVYYFLLLVHGVSCV